MNIALVEDTATEAEVLLSYIKRYGKENKIDIITTHFKCADELLKGYKQSYFDIVFMDVDLPGTSGLDAARLLRMQDILVTLIFVTKMGQYAHKGYEVNALDYIIKPVNYSDFELKFKRAVNIARANEVKSLLVPLSSGFCRVSTDKIVYVEVMGHQLRYKLVDGEIETRGTLGEVEKKLAHCGFLRCNNCYLVNSYYVKKVTGNKVDMGGCILEISHPRRRAFMEALMNIYSGDI